MPTQYLETLDHLINGAWAQPTSGESQTVVNPATNKPIGKLGHASTADLDNALAAAQSGFNTGGAFRPSSVRKILRKAADLSRARVEQIAVPHASSRAKFLAEAKIEVLGSADVIDWFAEEGRRAYGRIIPARAEGVRNMVMMEPVGPVAGFSPWNFPVLQAARKICGALAAGCSIIIKCPEETPGSPIEFVKCFQDAGVPPGVINLLYGVPAEISEYLIASPTIRKISFTGSVPVGKQLGFARGSAHEARDYGARRPCPGSGFRRCRHRQCRDLLGCMKYRNAGQVCVSPTRFFVQEKAYDKFVGQVHRPCQGREGW